MATPKRPTLKVIDLTDSDNTTPGDLYMETGIRFVWVDAGSVEAIAQKLRNRFRFFRGSWFLDRREGVPYTQAIFRRDVSLRAKREIVRQVIAGTPGIETVIKVVLTEVRSNRELQIDFEARTGDGTLLRSQDFAQPFIVETPEPQDA